MKTKKNMAERVPAWVMRVAKESRSGFTTREMHETVRVDIKAGAFEVTNSIAVDAGLSRSWGKYSIRLEAPGRYPVSFFAARYDDIRHGSNAAAAERATRDMAAVLRTGVRLPFTRSKIREGLPALLNVTRIPLWLAASLSSSLDLVTWLPFDGESTEFGHSFVIVTWAPSEGVFVPPSGVVAGPAGALGTMGVLIQLS